MHLGDTLQYRVEESADPWRVTLKCEVRSVGWRACAAPWRVTLNREVRSFADCRNLLFSWAYSAQTVHPPPKLTHKRHILGMSASPQNDSHCTKLCCLSCTPITNTPSKVSILAVLGNYKSPCAEIRKFFILWFTSYFNSGQNRCRVSGRKSALYWWQKTKRVLASLGEPLGRFPLIFVWVCTVTPLTYIPGFIQIGSGLGEI